MHSGSDHPQGISALSFRITPLWVVGEEILSTTPTKRLCWSSDSLGILLATKAKTFSDIYQSTTVVGHNFLNNRLADTQLKQLGYWLYTRNTTRPSSLAPHLHCKQAYSSEHYLFNCPTFPMYQRRLKSTFLSDIVIPLLLKDPPPINTTINNKDRAEYNTRWMCPIGDSQVS